MSIALKIFISGSLFLLAIVTGIWLSKSSKPLNTLIITVHKLIALAAAIFTGFIMYSLAGNAELAIMIITLIIVTAFFVLLLFISGALLSIEKTASNLMLYIHRALPILTLLTTSAIFYFLIIIK